MKMDRTKALEAYYAVIQFALDSAPRSAPARSLRDQGLDLAQSIAEEFVLSAEEIRTGRVKGAAVDGPDEIERRSLEAKLKCDVCALPGQATCDVKGPGGYHCSRVLGHPGNHAACGALTHPITTWPVKPQEGNVAP